MKINRWWVVFAAIFILGSGWLWVSRVPVGAGPREATPEPAVGRPAPDFTLETLDGGAFTLSAQVGTPIVLNFWATWCGPCQRELPALQLAAERYAGQVQIVGVDQGEDAAVVQNYVKQLGLSFAIPMDADHAVAHRYRVLGLPTTFFIDRNGVIRHLWTGEMNSITLAEGIARILP
jgi:peroxiredoxin